MRSFAYTALVAALTAVTAAVPYPGAPKLNRRDAFDDPLTSNMMHPIRMRDFMPENPLSKRTLDLENLAPSPVASLLFGGLSGEGHGKLFLANMTMQADKDCPIVNMENFEGLTSKVDCQGDDGQMSLTFKDKQAFQYALQKWSFINDNPKAHFLLITNHKGCGNQGQRQNYMIDKVTSVESQFEVIFAAQAVNWKKSVGNFDMQFGQYHLPRQSLINLQANGVIGWIGKAFEDFKNGADAFFKNGLEGIVDIIEDGNADISLPITIPMNIFKPGHSISIVKTTEVDLFCKNCYVAGKFLSTGTLKVVNYLPVDLRLDMEIKDWSSAAEFQFDLFNVKKHFTYDQEIFSMIIPYTGFEIPGVLSLGCKVGLSIAGTIDFFGDATINFGLTTLLPNGGKLSFVLIGSGQSGLTGLNDITAHPYVTFTKGNITLNSTTIPKPRLTCAATILGTIGAEAGVQFGIPIDLDVSTGNKPGGWCAGNPITTGVTIRAGFGFQVTIGIWQAGMKPLFTIPIINFPIKFPGLCLPLRGLEPYPTGIQGPTPTQTATIGLPPTSATATPTVTGSYPGVPGGNGTIPGTPGTPGCQPGKPGCPPSGGQPGNPGNGSPGAPGNGTTPGTPGTPGCEPGKPGCPPSGGQPGNPGSGQPGQPGNGYPGAPGNGTTPGSPGTPGCEPGKPGCPPSGGQPGNGQPGNGQPGNGQPGKPGSGQPGKPGSGVCIPKKKKRTSSI